MVDVIGIQLAQYALQTRPAHHHRPQLPSTRLTQLQVTARTTKKVHSFATLLNPTPFP